MTDAHAKAANDRLTRRESRRRLILLVLLLVALVIAALVVLRLRTDGAMPSIAMLKQDQIVAPPIYVYSITGSGKNAVGRPTGVAIAENGDVYTVDYANKRVSVFSRTGAFKFSFNKIAEGKQKTLAAPVNVDVAGNEVWVTDRNLSSIFIFGLDGTYKRRFKPAGLPKGYFGPLAITVKDNRVAMTDIGDTTKHRIVLASENGQVAKTVGSTLQVKRPEESPGKFMFPSGIAVAKDGRVFVSDGNNKRVQVFDRNGTFKYVVNTSGVPRGIDLDTKDRLYVVDALAHVVSIYTASGTKIVEFGSQGFGPGQFSFPNDVAIGPDNRIYVSDRENNQVQVWEWPAAVLPSPTALVGSKPWLFALLPLLLLPLIPLLRRRRRWIVSPTFVENLIASGRVKVLADRRSRFIAPESDEAFYTGRTIDGVRLDDVIVIAPHSISDALVYTERYGADAEQAAYLAMAERAKGLLTDDEKLTSLAVMAQIRVMGSAAFVNSGNVSAATAESLT